MSVIHDEKFPVSKDRSSYSEILRWMPHGVRGFLQSDRLLADAPQAVTDWLLKDGLVKKAERKTYGEYSYTPRGVEVRKRILHRQDSIHGGR